MKLEKNEVVAFDLETGLISNSDPAPEIVCLSWARGEAYGLLVGDDIPDWLEGLLLSSAMVVGHEISYDFSCILRQYPKLFELVWRAYEERRVTDTGIRERLLNISCGEFQEDGRGGKVKYHLTDIAFRRLNTKLEKGADTWRLRYTELLDTPLEAWPKDAIDYSILDARTTLALFLEQEERSREIGYKLPTQFDEVRAALALRLMQCWGICVDSIKVESLWKRLEKEVDTYAKVLKKVGIVTDETVDQFDLFNTTRQAPKVKKSMDTIRALVADYYPGEPPTTENGLIKTTATVLEECSDCEELQVLIQFNRTQKLMNTYVLPLLGAETTIRARFFAVGAASDRTSCRDPNLQNQPKEISVRECFVPREGYVFLGCDFDSQEMRTLAQACTTLTGSSRLAERYRQDRHFDPHLEFAASLAGISVLEAQARKNAGDRKIKELRQQAKICNFGFPGGMSSHTFVDYAQGWGINISAQKAEDLKKLWFQQWPEMRAYFAQIRALVGESLGTQIIPQSGFQRGGVGYKDVANGYFQSLAAHASKDALWEVSRKCFCDRSSYLYGSRPVLFIHDEIVLETPEFAGHEAAQELERVMVGSQERWTPDVPASASAVLMSYWSKSAHRIFDEGRLVPWDSK